MKPITASRSASGRQRTRPVRRGNAVVMMFAARVIRLLGVLWLVSLATFFLIDLIPGDPVANVFGVSATPEQIAHAREELGLNRGLAERYIEWVSGVLRFDFGETLVSPIRPVNDVMASALPITLELTVLAILIALVISIPLGVVASYLKETALDRAINGSSFAMLAVPSFVASLLLILLVVFNPLVVRLMFAVVGTAVSGYLLYLLFRRSADDRTPAAIIGSVVPVLIGIAVYFLMPSFPRQGWVPLSDGLAVNLRSAFLPALTLSFTLIPLYTQLLRTDMIHTLGQNFVTIARAKGASPMRIVMVEALRPSLFSLLTVAGISIGSLLGGSVVVETIFGLPGLGQTLVTAIVNSNYTVVQAGVLLTAFIFVFVNAAVDLAYRFLDPRIRRSEGA